MRKLIVIVSIFIVGGLVIFNFVDKKDPPNLENPSSTEINNIKTAKHQQIEGMKISLLPPDGFSQSNNFAGFEQEENNASILAAEIPGPFEETTKGFNKKDLGAKGVTLKVNKKLNLNGYEALFIEGEQIAFDQTFVKYVLAFGNEKTTYLINATFPKNLPDLGQNIKNSLYSVVYEPNLEVDPLSSVDFSINTEGTKLKFAASLSGALLYTEDGKLMTDSSPEKISLMVAPSLWDMKIEDKKAFSIQRLESNPYYPKVIANSIQPIEIDGMEGYEMQGVGSFEKKGVEVKKEVYQVILFKEDGYFILLGVAEINIEENMVLFKEVARSFKRK